MRRFDVPSLPVPDPASSSPRDRVRSYVLARLRRNPILRATMALALVCYGGLPVLVIAQTRAGPRMDFPSAALLLVLSLASWCLVFAWYPVLVRTALVLGRERRWLTQALESVAITCVAIVHLLLAVIILVRAGGG